MPNNGIGILLYKGNSQKFSVTEQAVKMRWAILFKFSHRTVIDHGDNTMIVSTTVLLIMYRCCMVLMLRACLQRHLVTLHVQILPRMELSTTVHGTSTSMSD